MTHRATQALVLAAMLGFVTTTAWAQAALGSRTSIDVSAANPQDVFASLAKTLECTLDIQAELQGPVTLKVSNITVRTALTALCESLGCGWSIEGGSLRIRPARTTVRLKGPVTRAPRKTSALLEKFKRNTGPGVRFDNTPVRDVLAALSKIADMEITADEPLASQAITVDLSNRGIDAALKELLKQAGAEKVAYLTGSTRDGEHVRMKIVAKVAKEPAKTIKLRSPRIP